jgi:hypothetical protein
VVAVRQALFAGVVVVAGCASQRQEPRAPAVEQAAYCGEEPSVSAARFARPGNVEAVEPLYGVVYSTPNGQESRLLGAKLRLRGDDGTTAESLSRALHCHAATEVLRADDGCPYWIPDGSVEIGVKFVGGGYLVTLEGQDFRRANEILARARAFARN